MIISVYRNTRDIDVYFPEYDWTKRSDYKNFKKALLYVLMREDLKVQDIQVKENINLEKTIKKQDVIMNG